MAKYTVLVTGIVLRDGTIAKGNTDVDEAKILGDIDALVKGKFIKVTDAKKSKAKDDAAIKAASDELRANYKTQFNADAPEKASDDDIQNAVDKNEVIEAPLV